MQGPKEIGDIETDDEKDEEEQYEQWKSREMRRIRWVIMHPVCQQVSLATDVFRHSPYTNPWTR